MLLRKKSTGTDAEAQPSAEQPIRKKPGRKKWIRPVCSCTDPAADRRDCSAGLYAAEGCHNHDGRQLSV